MLKKIQGKLNGLGAGLPETTEISQDEMLTGPGLLPNAAFPVLIAVLILFGFITSWIHYPEIVKARAVITKISHNDSVYLAEIDLPQNNGFRIDSGLTIQLHIDDYTQFGYVRGVLGHVSYTPKHHTAHAILVLPAGLTTSKNLRISLKQPIKADMLITIKDMMLFQRIFYNARRKASIHD